MPLSLFETLNISDEEKVLEEELLKYVDASSKDIRLAALNNICIFYLAKQIEHSAETTSDEIAHSISRLNIAMNTNVNNIIQSNKALADSNTKQATALNRMTAFLVFLTIVLVIMTGVMLYKM